MDPTIAQVFDHTPELEKELSRLWRERHPLPKGEKEILAYDLTNVLFFGVTCPMATPGRNPVHLNRLQVNVGAVVSRHDRMLWRQFVYRGNRHGIGTIRNLLVEFQRAGVCPGLLIVDRGLVGREIVEEAQGAGWQLLGGLARSTKEVREILDTAKLPENPSTFVQKTRSGAIYATKVRARLRKAERDVVLYTNSEHALDDRVERDPALATIGKALTTPSEKGKAWSEGKLHAAIGEAVGGWAEFVKVRVRRGGATSRVGWSFRDRAIREATRRDGK